MAVAGGLSAGRGIERPRAMSTTVVGAAVAGLCCAIHLTERGHRVTAFNKAVQGGAPRRRTTPRRSPGADRATNTSRRSENPPSTEPNSSWVAAGLDQVRHEDGGDERGGAAGAAAQLGQDLPAFEGGDSAFAEGADAGVGAVD